MSETSATESNENLKATLDYAVTPSQLLPTLEHLLSSRAPNGEPKEMASAMIWGAMGVGKTDIVRTVASLWEMRVVALHLPQYDPTDLKGIPVKTDDDRVVWVPSSYLPRHQIVRLEGESKSIRLDMPSAEDVMVHVKNRKGKEVARFNDKMNGELKPEHLKCHIDMWNREVNVEATGGKNLDGLIATVIDKAVLFLDELSAAVPEVQNAALQLCLDRRVGEYDVPPYVPIVAAGNRESDAAFVHPMSAPLANRFAHLRLVPSLDDWIEWAMLKRVSPQIIGYLQWKKGSRLFKFDESKLLEGDCGFPTPRSWYKLSQQMTPEGFDRLPDAIQNSVITGFIGKYVGHEFIGYRKVCELLPSPDDILQGKKVEISSELDIGARYGLATSLCYALEYYHDKYFDENIDDMKKQPQEWRTATKAFCDFIDNYLGKEMTVLCVHIVSKHLGISFTKFRSTSFRGFAQKYRNVLRKTV